jgi:hypothetical protein
MKKPKTEEQEVFESVKRRLRALAATLLKESKDANQLTAGCGCDWCKQFARPLAGILANASCIATGAADAVGVTGQEGGQ